MIEMLRDLKRCRVISRKIDMHAKDIMAKSVITGTEDSTVLDLAELMLKHHISAIPIIGNDRTLVGIVSEGDLVRRAENETAKPGSWWLALFAGKTVEAERFIKSHSKFARDVMTKDVLVAEEDATLEEIADQLERNRIKRLPIVRGKALVGIVSRANLIQAIVSSQLSNRPHKSKSDTDIRTAILSTLDQEPWFEGKHANVIVEDGVVYLWGTVTSETEARALHSAAASTPGVKDVKNNIAVAKVLYSAIGV